MDIADISNGDCGRPGVSNGGDTMVLVGVSVTGNTLLRTGNGNNDIAVLGGAGGPDEAFGGSFTIDAGNGNDNVVIADGAVFLDNVTLNLGKGNDVVWLAGDLFQQSVNINGGPGNDTLMQSGTLFPNDFVGGPPTETSIENNLPDVSPSDPDVVAAFGWLSGLLGV